MLANNKEHRFPSTSVPSTSLPSKALSVASARTYNYPHFTEEDAEAQRKAVAGGWGWRRGSSPGLPGSGQRLSTLPSSLDLWARCRLPLPHQAWSSLRTGIGSHLNPCLPHKAHHGANAQPSGVDVGMSPLSSFFSHIPFSGMSSRLLALRYHV